MGAASARAFEHAREWARLGHEVTVVCGKPNHPDGIVPPKYRGTPLHRERSEGINVMRCWLYATPNRGVVRRSIAFMSFMFSSIFFGSFFSGRCDVVVATSPQLLCALGGYVVSIMKRRPFVFEVRDLWPKQIIDLGMVKNPMILWLLKKVEELLYWRACTIVAVAEATRKEIVDRGIPPEKIVTISNGINESFFAPRDRMVPLRETYGWGDDIVVMYIGTHGLSQGLANIIETVSLLQHRKDIRFVFAGQGAEREMLMEMARERRLTNAQFLPMQRKELMPEFYAAADICLVPLKKRDYFLYNIPSKMFEIMACARPIVLGVQGQALQVLQEADSGIAVEPENPKAYAEAILKLADNPELRARFGANGRKYVTQHYTRQQKARAYSEHLKRVIGKD